MQPVACTGCPKRPWIQLFQVDFHDWHAVPSLSSRQVCVVPLESPGAHWPGSTLAKSQCPSALSCRTRSMWSRPSLGPSSSSPATTSWIHISKKWAFTTKFSADELENVREKWHLWDGWGPHVIYTTLMAALWTKGRPCTLESLGAVPSLLMPTNKSYFPIKKGKKELGQRVRMELYLVALCNHMDCSPPSSSVRGFSPGKNTGVDFYALLQGIFPIQGLNPGLQHCKRNLYWLSHQGSPRIELG